MEAELRRFLGEDHGTVGDLAQLESRAKELALSLAARAVERLLNAGGRCQRQVVCGCGRPARYVGQRPKFIQTVLGVIRVWRAYYHCSHCRRGFCPRDKELGVEGGCLSPGVVRMIALVGASVSFEEGSELMRELAGVVVGPKAVERAAEELGREIARDERRGVEVDTDPPAAPTLYLGIDGTGIPMRREEVEGRPGKQPDGSARTREVKICTVWSAESRDADGRPVRDRGSVTYTAAIESAASPDTAETLSPFAQRVAREARRRGFDRAERQVVLGDGAPFIWNTANELFPRAIQIVDRYHAKEHLHEVSRAIWGPSSPTGARWAEARCEELDRGDLDTLIERLEVHAATSEAARRCANYIRRNRHRMRYALFHKMGLCTSTGIVEAACKHVIGTRLKRPGMHWSVAGANAIIALRCAKLSGRLDHFLERRYRTTTATAA